MLDGRAQILVAVKFLARLDKHVLAHLQIAKAVMRALHPAGCPFAAFADHHHQIHVTVVVRNAPCVRAKEPDLLRLKFSN